MKYQKQWKCHGGQPGPHTGIEPDGVPGRHFTKTFSPVTANNPIEHFMDIQQLYVTFTNKKVVTSMLLLGIGLGLVLSAMTRYLAGKWYMPTAFVGICLVVAIVYMYWLDRQDWSD